jgi:hypothetical protein
VFLSDSAGTVVRIGEVQDIEVGVVDDGGEPLRFHLVDVGPGARVFGVDCRFGDVKQTVYQRSLPRVLPTEDDHGGVRELSLCSCLVEELLPHFNLLIINLYQFKLVDLCADAPSQLLSGWVCRHLVGVGCSWFSFWRCQ